MTFELPRGLIVDTNNIPDDFEDQVQKVFEEYTECTHRDYTYQDKLLFIDVCVHILHGDLDNDVAVMEHMKDFFEYEVSECGTFPNESDFLSIEFMESCYDKGVKSQKLYFNGYCGYDEHERERIMKILIRLIKAILDYEKEG